MLAESEKNRPSHHENRQEFLKSVVVEQLLIQEAKRQKIDQEPQFREAIKNHYEQSLVKILLERKNQSLDETVTEGGNRPVSLLLRQNADIHHCPGQRQPGGAGGRVGCRQHENRTVRCSLNHPAAASCRPAAGRYHNLF